MSTNVQSLVFYFSVYGIVLYLLWMGKKNKISGYIGILILMLVSALRFDVGSDYRGYYFIIKNVHDVLQSWTFPKSFFYNTINGIEPALYIATFLTLNFEDYQIITLSIFSSLNIYLWYAVLKKYNAVFWGFFTIIKLSILFTAYNQVRQSLAIAIFIFSVPYIIKGDLKRYILCILVGSLCHYSIILVAWAYLLRNVKPRPRFYVTTIVICFILGLLGLWNNLIPKIYSFVSFYDKYEGLTRYTLSVAYGTGLTIIVKVIVCIFLIIKISKSNPFLSNCLFTGALIAIVASGNLGIMRMSNYFYFMVILAIPAYFSITKNRTLIASIVMAMTVYFGANMFVPNGCVPYQSIFSYEYAHKIFWDRK